MKAPKRKAGGLISGDGRLSRRTVTRLLGAGGVSVLLARCAPLPRAATVPTGAAPEPARADWSPIDRALPDRAAAAFSGDDPSLAHRILWDKPAFLAARGGALPVPEERVPLVVIGGGIAGLTSAYALRAHRPVVLEQAPRFGGNSRGEAWRGIDYAIGAAYFIEPDEGTEIAALLAELGLAGAYTVKTTEDPVVLRGRRYDEFWHGVTAPEARAQLDTLRKHFLAYLEGEEGHEYPDIPVFDDEGRRRIDALDRTTFVDHLRAVAGGPLHPHVETVVEHYCWSSFGASSTEISAASGLNFYCAEFGNVAVMPGGNAGVAERLLARLERSLPAGSLRPRSLVLDVRPVADGVVVSYVDGGGTLRALHARAAVVACPKFVVPKLVDTLEPERAAAIDRLRYRAYLVANVLLGAPVKPDFYDLFMAGDGTVNLADVEAAANRQRVTDVVLATYARHDARRSVLTLYRGIPYDGARAALYEEGAYATARREFEEQIAGEILPLVGLRQEHVLDLRLTRWGHPLPVAEAGLIAGRTVDALRAPLAGRVFFVNQDNWALPAFETAITEALHYAPQVDGVLRG
jgi:phytoene dehydrogenase-like protein